MGTNRDGSRLVKASRFTRTLSLGEMYWMKQRVSIAMVAAFIAGCSMDRTSAPLAVLDGGAAEASGGVAEATPVDMTIFPAEIIADGTNTATGRVNVDAIVSCCDRFVHVTSNNPSVLPFLSTGATVSAGASFAAVQLMPTAVSTRTVVTIFVTGNGVTVSADLTLDPRGTTVQRTLSSFTVSPGTVNGGTTATGTVTTPQPAPAGGLVVNLSSRQPGSAAVPSSVTIPEGATSVTFPVTTFAGFPNSTTCVRMAATTASDFAEGDICVVTGGSETGTTLTAPSLLRPSSDQRFARGTTINFDWSDVAGATSYRLQIDDRDSFRAPLTLDRTVTASQLSVSGLPATRLFWRVRAINSSGAAGPWSPVRRFEIK